ncbi:MAG: transglutaminase domain-containing protein [Elusimicrobia bacterium]|nr:transglutaminase domain-containing protein [Elusimicrobiota bacterium]
MSVPPLLLGAALLFWGWQTGFWAAAVPLALALESPRLFSRRWEVSREGFDRVVDLCGWGFVALAVFLYFTRERTAASMLAVAWIPLCYGPLLAVQLYSAQGKVEYGSLFLFFRNKPWGSGPGHSIDLGYPYLALCLFCAAAANVRTPGYYLGLCALCGWALWPSRPKGAAAAAWAALLAAAGLLGWAGQAGLHGLQGALEQKAQDWVFGSYAAGFDPWQSRTAIGRMGELKQSGGIRLRVRPAPGQRPPALLRQAAYDFYFDRQWSARGRASRSVPSPREGVWSLGPESGAGEEVSISASLPRGQGLLSLPRGAFRVEELLAGGLSRGGLGAVMVEDGPSLAQYRAAFVPGADFDLPPGPEDLALPRAEKGLFLRLARELGLGRLAPGAAAAKVSRFFADGFRYSLYQERGGARPLEDFLLRTRAGHCEHFATATVLLLRAAGVPARYAAGYSVQEYSRLEKAYVARGRHAHAWSEAYLDGRWQDLDTTPSTWLELERQRAPRGEGLRDAWAWLSHRFARWRWSRDRGPAGNWLAWLLAPLLLILAWRLRGLAGAARQSGPGSSAPGRERPGLDSELYGVERRLAERGLGRRPYETWTAWAARISPQLEGERARRLAAAAALHSRYRFDPAGLDAEGRAALRREAAALESG